ncbi:hypothetical protein [uncultured Jannaschia sp.]|uniref:hypothetical protein n=1 Tax=uncultured Jannaschia sp. TaxID=293347 RepID=UPI002611C316|nr:hypothetical protein [uncultured Jannaschia sp.]
MHQAEYTRALVRAHRFAAGDAAMRLPVSGAAHTAARAIAGPSGPGDYLLVSPWTNAADALLAQPMRAVS